MQPMDLPATLYVDLRGHDRDHTNFLTDTVTTTLRGVGLAYRTEADRKMARWPGAASVSTVTEAGDAVRIGTTWRSVTMAAEVGDVVTEWFLANLWHEVLVAVFVVPGSQYALTRTLHGEARSFIELAHHLGSLPYVTRPRT